MAVSVGEAVKVVESVGKAVSGSIEFINNVRKTGWAHSQLEQELEHLDCVLKVIQIKIDVARIPTQQHAFAALRGLQRQVQYAQVQLSTLEEAVVKADKETGPVGKAGTRLVKNIWDTTILPKWKVQLPQLTKYVKDAHAAAEEKGAFKRAETLARMPPSMYVPHLQLRDKVIAALREQMDKIDQQQPANAALQPEQQQQQSQKLAADKPAIVLIVGQPCLGKATLALDVTNAVSMKQVLKYKFPHGVFDITFGPIANLHGKSVIKQAMRSEQQELYRKITTEKVDPDEDVSTRLGAVLFGRRSLLLLEDVHSKDIVEAFRVAGFKGALLVTGHGHGLKSCRALTGATIEVTAADYTAAPSEGGPSVAQRIVDACLHRWGLLPTTRWLHKIGKSPTNQKSPLWSGGRRPPRHEWLPYTLPSIH